MGKLIAMNKALGMVEGQTTRRQRFNAVVRVKRISSKQLADLTKLGFVVLLETQPGFFSRLVG